MSGMAALAPFLERVYARYHDPCYLGSDPLVVVHGFREPHDREIAALFAALLAYGNVKQINASLARLFDAMEGRPGQFVREFAHSHAHERLRTFKHRFTDAEDVLCLCHLLHQAIARQPLETMFARHMRNEESDLVGAASRFIEELLSGGFGPHFSRRRMLAKQSFKHLLPRPDAGSACKRIHLFLRWMVRRADGIDLGLWPSVPASRLLIPVDTHVMRIAANLGLLRRKSASVGAAREITANLRQIDPGDPVRFDFSLCRLGILQECPTSARIEACAACALGEVCERHATMR